MTAQSRKIKLAPGKRSWIIRSNETNVEDYEFDWARFLEQSEGISTATTPNSNNVTIDSTSISGQKVTVFLSAVALDQEGYFDLKIVTNNGTPRTFEVRIRVIGEDY